ncbi:hypothetical protein PUR28_22200 [Streptomyces sp. BE308]|uniref:hypothetical protein n=1 Tax=Streptomyces sp. BE308 TaxID=3002529 RepID=UPI002E78DE89|nr:hypothetical protein [Streptomyces sp. BE308]MEE1793442.1 hypothetical protein [Streptomyces sp. BE308]
MEGEHDDPAGGLWRGAVEAALRHYRAFLRQPGRYLDTELRRRTLPDPLAHRRVRCGGGRWHRRLYDGEFRW